MVKEATVVYSQSPPEFLRDRVATPALIYDRGRLGALAGVADRIRRRYGAKVLFAVKACAFFDVLEVLSPSLDGFAVSSLFEARLVHDLYPDRPIHLTTPSLRESEIDELADICSFVTFNSETQLHHFGPRVDRYASVGLRVNTQLSYVGDPRYDPALRHSKLGVPLTLLSEVITSAPLAVNGLHFHTNVDWQDLGELEANVEALAKSVIHTSRFDWLNLGGGYLFENISVFEPLERSVALAKRDIANQVFVEPGAGLVRAAGHLIASVVDLFERGGTRIAV